MSVANSDRGKLEKSRVHQDWEKETVKAATENFQQEAKRLKGFAQEVEEIIGQIQKFEKKARDNIARLERELFSLAQQQKRNQASLKEFKDKHASEKMQVSQLRTDYKFTKKKRVALADTLNPKRIMDLEIEDRKSEAHQVFMWILSVIYKEPIAKYYWQNFLDQAFKNDKGADLKERLGKMSAGELKQDERVATQKLLENKDALLSHNDFKNEGARTEIQKVLEIAELILQGSDIAKQERELDAVDIKNKDQETLKQDTIDKLNTKISAIQERIDINFKYQTVLEGLQKRLVNKGEGYLTIVNQGLKIVKDLKNNKPLTPIPFVPPTISPPAKETPQKTSEKAQEPQKPEKSERPNLYNTQTESRDVCTCLLF